jgi:tetratricopeptide (TPR) repeat protein
LSYNQGCLFQQEGKYQDSVRCYEQSLVDDPLHLQSYYNLAILFQTLLEYKVAEQLYQKVIELDPFHQSAHYNLGSLYQDQNLLDLSETSFLSALSLAPTDCDTLICLGILSKQRKLYQKSLDYYSQAMAVDASSKSMAAYNLGNLYHEMGDLDNSIAAYSDALRAHPTDANIIHNLCIACQEKAKLIREENCPGAE